MIQRMITILICCACIGCAAKKNAVSPEKIAALHTLLKSKNIHINAERAYPMMSNAMQQVFNSELLGPNNSGRAIDITSTTNYIKIAGDSLYVALPFFGELQSGAITSGTDISISFKGKPLKYTSTYNAQKKTYKLQIGFKTKRERFNMYISLFSNGTTNINVLSSHRSSISYRGAVDKKE